MKTENLKALKIHRLTKEQYTRENEAGTLDDSALYLTPAKNLDSVVYTDEDEEILDASVEVVDADTLCGRPFEDFATKEFVAETITEVREDIAQNIDLSNYATKDDLSNLSAEDIEARPITWLPTLEELGAAPAGEYATTSDLARLTYADVGAAPAGDYATESFVTNKIAEAQLDGSGDIDLTGYATKDDISEAIRGIDYPVDSVNGKVGAVTLSAGDVGAATSSHTHNYAGSSSAGGAANSVKANLAVKLNGGTTEGTNLFTYNGSAAKTVNITPSAIGAAASSHGNHVPATQTANNATFLRNDNSWQKVTPANIGAAASSHGNHVPTKQTASNKVFLRNDNTWQTVTPANIGAVPTGFTSDVSGAVQFRKSNGMVYVCTPTRYAVIGAITIPAGYRPAVNTAVQGLWLPTDYSINTACVEFKTNGTITVQKGVSETLNGNHGWFSVNCCYPAG